LLFPATSRNFDAGVDKGTGILPLPSLFPATSRNFDAGVDNGTGILPCDGKGVFLGILLSPVAVPEIDGTMDRY
jgi:hypothetical protein